MSAGNRDRDLPVTIVFLHVPKAAGSTLIYALKRLYGKDHLWVRNCLGWPMDVPVDPPSSARVYAGHMSYGIHRRLDRPVTYITMIRHPLQRLISAYFYLRTRRQNPLHPLVSTMSLEDFLGSDPVGAEFDNGQVRRLTLQGPSLPVGAATEDLLTEVLERCGRGELYIGLTDDFDRSILTFSSILGWSTPFYWTQNRRKENSRPKVPAELAEAVLDRNRLDMELYEQVRDWIADAEGGYPRISDEAVSRYQRRNRYWYRMAVTPVMAMRKLKIVVKKRLWPRSRRNP